MAEFDLQGDLQEEKAICKEIRLETHPRKTLHSMFLSGCLLNSNLLQHKSHDLVLWDDTKRRDPSLLFQLSQRAQCFRGALRHTPCCRAGNTALPHEPEASSAWSSGDTATPHAGEVCGNLLFFNADEEQQFSLLHKVQFSRIGGSVISQPTPLGLFIDTFQ